MHKFRSTWLALMGGAILVTLSISAAFGADPATTDANRGQTIAGFVHGLIFTQDEPTDEETEGGDEDADESETDEDADEFETDEDADESDADLEEDTEEETSDDTAREVPAEFANHGECVSEAAQDKDAWEGDELKNHGEWVSMHARYICWGLTPPGEETSEEATDEDAALEDEATTEELSAKEERKAEKAAARAERASARSAENATKANGGGHGKP